jgi:hypothetical protein
MNDAGSPQPRVCEGHAFFTVLTQNHKKAAPNGDATIPDFYNTLLGIF